MISASHWISEEQTYLLKLRGSFRIYWFVQNICCIYGERSSSSANWTRTSSYRRIGSIRNFPFYTVSNCQLRCDRIQLMYPCIPCVQVKPVLTVLDAMSSLCPHGRNVKLLSCSYIIMGNVKLRRSSMERNVPDLYVQIPGMDFAKTQGCQGIFFLFFLRLPSSAKAFLVLFRPEPSSRLRRKADQENYPILQMWTSSLRMLSWLGKCHRTRG